MFLARRSLLRLFMVTVIVGSVAVSEPASADAVLKKPGRGATVVNPPELKWKRVPSARFYNVQVYREGRKILSRWPRRARFDLNRSWRHRGHKIHFRAGIYRWYVWPHYRKRYGHRVVRSWFQAGRRPRNISPPRLSGSAREGALLVVSPGSWAGTKPIRVTYRWQRCNAEGMDCVDVVGQGAQSYLLSAADIGTRIRVIVTARNWLGERSATTTPTAAVLPAAPILVAPPQLRGPPQVGRLLITDLGAWASSRPLTYELRWEACRDGKCRRVADARGRSLVIRPWMVERTVRAVVTASNTGGSAAAATRLTKRVGLVLRGTQLADRLTGTGGSDVLAGRGADDVLRGGPGPDSLNGGPGRDRLAGGPGDDVLTSRDAKRDVVSCGGGADLALADRRDRVDASCEKIQRAEP